MQFYLFCLFVVDEWNQMKHHNATSLWYQGRASNVNYKLYGAADAFESQQYHQQTIQLQLMLQQIIQQHYQQMIQLQLQQIIQQNQQQMMDSTAMQRKREQNDMDLYNATNYGGNAISII